MSLPSFGSGIMKGKGKDNIRNESCMIQEYILEECSSLYFSIKPCVALFGEAKTVLQSKVLGQVFSARGCICEQLNSQTQLDDFINLYGSLQKVTHP